ncbi:glutathione S-transferase U7-like [Durio zibethinus]|uniref:glutathione transferase n=1 Tax=Durio zibethinus TaxID=66656 RepID=A0A6P5XN58_DURZI|nr:glutathione S-transferase U7-like [Durio zibethinus]
MAEVKLFGFWASPFSRRVELALKLKGISYEYIEEDLSNKSPSVLKYNPIHKKVPILVHKEKPLAESLVILEYLDETWKSNPILPQDPYERATARFWRKFIDEMLLPTATRANRSTGKEQEQAKEEVHQQLKILEDELKGKEFFSGQRIGYLDIVANILFWFEYPEEVTVGKVLTPEKFPIIYEWIQKLKKVDVVNECRVQKEKYQDFIKSISVVKP